MRHELAVRDHGALQHAVARTALAGAAAGLLHAVHPGAVTDALAFLLVGTAAVPPRTLRSAAWALALACGAAGAAMLGGVGATIAVGLAALLFTRDLDGGEHGEAPSAGRRLLAALMGGGALALGAFVHFGLADSLDGVVAPALAWLGTGAAAGFLSGFGVLGRELDWVPAALPSPQAAIAGELSSTTAMGRSPSSTEPEDDELGDLVRRARAACADVEPALARDVPGAATAARDLLGRVDGFAIRFREIERQLRSSDRAELVSRRERLAERAAAASDDVVREEYRRAERALAEQLADLDAIRGWQERALARLHHHVAVLERVRLAALHRRSAESGQGGDALSPLVDELAAASLDLDGAAEVLAALPG